MSTASQSIAARAISPREVRPDGWLTVPRSFGLYELSRSASGTRRFRFGNHPVRMRELEREFGSCELVHLFLQRKDALDLARLLNGRES